MPYTHFTDDQKSRAGKVDLEQFLLRRGENLLPSGHERRRVYAYLLQRRGISREVLDTFVHAKR